MPLAPTSRWRLLDWPRWLRLVVAGGYVALLTSLLLAPASTFEEVELFPGEDKVVHGLLFLALALLARWAAPARFAAGRLALGLAAALALYAGGIEALQPSLTGGDRQFEWLDMGSNFAGIAAGWLLFAAAAAGAAVPPITRGSGR